MRALPLHVTAVFLLAASSAAAEPRFAVEAGGGQNIGLTSYVDNVVVLQGDLPLLADDLPGSGAAFNLNFIFGTWAVGGNVRLFDRETIRLHHRGTTTLPPNRVRPNGSVDDSGIEYVEFGPVRSPSPTTQPGDLMVIDIGAAYRYRVIDGAFSLWIPARGSLVATKIMETSQPTIFGASVATGLGISYDIAPPIGIFLSGLVHGVLTPAYRPLSDASRGSFAAGESTEEAVFSSMAYASVVLGLQFTVR